MLMDPFGLPVASARSTGTLCTMTFINNSNNSWNFCCYQKDPGILDAGAFSAAWFVATVVHPTTSIKFQWTIAYGLSWSQSGVVSLGTVYFPAQNWPVTAAQNTVTLTKLGGSYTFQDSRQQAPQTAFNIVQDGTVVVQNGIGVGTSMKITGASGGGDGLNTIYAQPAQPNVTTQYTVTPSYWVVFAQNIQPGQILNVANMTNTAEVTYDPGVYSMVVTLDVQNIWSTATTAAINAKYLHAVQRDPDITWEAVAALESRPVEAQS